MVLARPKNTVAVHKRAQTGPKPDLGTLGLRKMGVPVWYGRPPPIFPLFNEKNKVAFWTHLGSTKMMSKRVFQIVWYGMVW